VFTEVSVGTTAASNAGVIALSADTVEIVDSFIESTTSGTGAAGRIDVSGRDVEIIGSSVATSTFGPARGGDLLVSADTVSISNSEVTSDAGPDSTAAPGAVSVSANRSIEIDDGALLSADTFANCSACLDGGAVVLRAPTISIDAADVSVGTGGPARGGNLTVQADVALSLTNGAGLAASTSRSGRAGDVLVQGGEIVLADGATIDALTVDAGDAGSVTILGKTVRANATPNGAPLAGAREVVISSQSTVAGGPRADVGAAGLVRIEGESITLSNTEVSATVESDDVTNAPASIAIVASSGDLALLDSDVTTSTSGNSAAGSISLRGANIVLSSGTLVSAQTSGGGIAGDIEISTLASQVTLDAATVQATSTGTGAGGSITLDAGTLALGNGSAITTRAEQAPGGSIEMTLEDALLMSAGRIEASAGANGDGGDVTVEAGQVFLQKSAILARADDGDGGAINLTVTGADQLFVMDSESAINADSATGTAGEINLNAPDADLDSALQEQSADLTATPELAANACSPAATGDASTFVQDDDGGTPVAPDRYFAANAAVLASPPAAFSAPAAADTQLAAVQHEPVEACR
jgi:large exoprotein involved in heme utilization and adhesion